MSVEMFQTNCQLWAPVSDCSPPLTATPLMTAAPSTQGRLTWQIRSLLKQTDMTNDQPHHQQTYWLVLFLRITGRLVTLMKDIYSVKFSRATQRNNWAYILVLLNLLRDLPPYKLLEGIFKISQLPSTWFPTFITPECRQSPTWGLITSANNVSEESGWNNRKCRSHIHACILRFINPWM